MVLAEERRGLLVGSVLATREVSGAEEVNRRIDRLREASAEDALRALAAALAAAIHALLQAGVDHPDLHVGNFLARPDGALVALDMHSAWIVPRPVGPRTVRRRLAKLAHSLAVGMVVPPPSALDEVRWFADAYAALDPRLGPGTPWPTP